MTVSPTILILFDVNKYWWALNENKNAHTFPCPLPHLFPLTMFTCIAGTSAKMLFLPLSYEKIQNSTKCSESFPICLLVWSTDTQMKHLLFSWQKQKKSTQNQFFHFNFLAWLYSIVSHLALWQDNFPKPKCFSGITPPHFPRSFKITQS